MMLSDIVVYGLVFIVLYLYFKLSIHVFREPLKKFWEEVKEEVEAKKRK